MASVRHFPIRMPHPSASFAADSQPLLFGLLRRRACVRPTWRGWLAMVLCAGLAGAMALRGAYGFLAVQDPVPGGVLAMEGWTDDLTLARAWAEYQRGGYAVWCVTGEPLEKGAALSEYHDYAALTVAAYEKMGGPRGALHPVPWETVRRDRTYASALALKAWLRERGLPAERINVITSGAHARRSRLLYEKAFGPGSRIGVIAEPERDFDPEHWWQSSMGFRAMVGELVAYAYARFLFRGQ